MSSSQIHNENKPSEQLPRDTGAADMPLKKDTSSAGGTCDKMGGDSCRGQQQCTGEQCKTKDCAGEWHRRADNCTGESCRTKNCMGDFHKSAQQCRGEQCTMDNCQGQWHKSQSMAAR